MKKMWVYILECSDKSYYTGVANNLEKRLFEHNSGIHQGYTSTRLPVRLLFSEEFNDPRIAIEREKQIKGWSRNKKEALIKSDYNLLVELSKNIKKKSSRFDKASMTR